MSTFTTSMPTLGTACREVSTYRRRCHRPSRCARPRSPASTHIAPTYLTKKRAGRRSAPPSAPPTASGSGSRFACNRTVHSPSRSAARTSPSGTAEARTPCGSVVDVAASRAGRDLILLRIPRSRLVVPTARRDDRARSSRDAARPRDALARHPTRNARGRRHRRRRRGRKRREARRRRRGRSGLRAREEALAIIRALVRLARERDGDVVTRGARRGPECGRYIYG